MTEIVLASWVHVSDLHFGHGGAGHQWNQVRVLEALRLDAIAVVEQNKVPRPGFIFVTGDIAFSGGARTPAAGGTEYALASRWFEQLRGGLAIPLEGVFVVPGNHDIDRRADNDVRRLLKLARAGEETIDAILQTPTDLERLRGRMASYLKFSEGFGPPVDDRLHGGLWWRHTVSLEEGVSLRICGLNTALLSLDDQDQGKLQISEHQLADLFVPAPGARELAVVLGHHPVAGNWLADQKITRGEIDGHAAIHLFGHLHEAESEQARHGWGAGCLRIAAGAAHAEAGPSPMGHGYNFGALVVLDSGELAVRIWPRRWATSGPPRFVPDVDHVDLDRGYAEHRLPEKYRIPRPARTAKLRRGDVLGGRYELIGNIGQGGVGQVWEARDRQRNEKVAVKVLNPDGEAPDAGRRDAFFRGARAVAGLDHPAIARVRDPRPDKQHGPYEFYVMDYIDAPNLSVAVTGAPRSDAETIALLLAIGEGVAAAHRKGVIHRDLKPSNILFDSSRGRVHIIDFDTAKELTGDTETRSKAGLASMYYAAPEVVAGSKQKAGGVHQPGAGADIFSLAVIGIFVRTGQNPPHFNLPIVIRDMACGPGLRRVLEKGCEHEAASRYGSVDELLAALRGLGDGGDDPSGPWKPESESPPAKPLKPEPPPAKPESSKSEPAPPEPSKPEPPPAKPESWKPEPAPPEPSKPSKPEAPPAKPESWKPEPPPGEPPGSATGRRLWPPGRAMKQAGGVLLAGFVAVGLFMWPGGSPPGSDPGIVAPVPPAEPLPQVAAAETGAVTGSNVTTKPLPQVAAETSAVTAPNVTAATTGVVVDLPPDPVRCDREDLKPDGTSCVPRCPEGTKFIRGTHGAVFNRLEEQRDIDDFCLDITEVTVAAFREKASEESFGKSKTLLLEGKKRSEYNWEDKYCNARRKDREDHPMNCVDWEQASAHCESIGGRLPTEWEWEWAARGRDEGRGYPWGSEAPDCKRAIFSPGSVDGCGKDRTWPVGSVKGAMSDTRDGLQDMSGNVWEWTMSTYDGNDSPRVLRGGGWGNVDAGGLRASYRNRRSPASRSYGVGFRCARTTL